MEERRRKGLYYYYNDKYSPTHRCLKGKVFLMEGCELMHRDQIFSSKIDCDDSGLELQIQEEVGEVQQPEISLHAITGSPNPKTMRLIGTIKSHEITILVD
jgi:hypothetical protein